MLCRHPAGGSHSSCLSFTLSRSNQEESRTRHHSQIHSLSVSDEYVVGHHGGSRRHARAMVEDDRQRHRGDRVLLVFVKQKIWFLNLLLSGEISLKSLCLALNEGRQGAPCLRKTKILISESTLFKISLKSLCLALNEPRWWLIPNFCQLYDSHLCYHMYIGILNSNYLALYDWNIVFPYVYDSKGFPQTR